MRHHVVGSAAMAVLVGLAGIVLLMARPALVTAHGWQAPDQAAARVNPVPVGPESTDRGKQLFARFCAACHGANGAGDGPVAPSLTPPPANLKVRAGMHSDGDLFWKIANGRGAMPGFNRQLEESQIWELTSFIRHLK